MRHLSRLVLSVLTVPVLMGATLTVDDAAFSPQAPATAAKPPLTITLSPDQQKALRQYAQQRSRQIPQPKGGGDAIPPCYMVYGYGRDAHGNGPYLDASGNALPMSGDPRTVNVWGFHDSSAEQKTAVPTR